MPFLQIYWDAAVLDADTVAHLTEVMVEDSATELCRADPAHVVTPAMLDVRVAAMGPLDRFRSAVFVSLFARWEAAREESSDAIAVRLADAARRACGTQSVVVEVLLTHHSSSFDYATLE